MELWAQLVMLRLGDEEDLQVDWVANVLEQGMDMEIVLELGTCGSGSASFFCCSWNARRVEVKSSLSSSSSFLTTSSVLIVGGFDTASDLAMGAGAGAGGV